MKRKSWQASFRTEVCKLPNMSDLPRCGRVLCVAQYPTYSWSLKLFFVELINKEKNNSISKAKEKVAKSNAPQKRLFKVILKLGLYWTIACIQKCIWITEFNKLPPPSHHWWQQKSECTSSLEVPLEPPPNHGAHESHTSSFSSFITSYK